MSLKNESCESQYDGSSMEEFSVGAMLPIVPLNSEKKENSLSDTSIEELIDNTNKEADKNEKNGIELAVDSTFKSLEMNLVEKTEEEEEEFDGVIVEGYCFFEEDVDWFEESTKEIDEDIKEVIDTLNKKGYTTKYSCSGHPSGRFKKDRYRDGILHKKLYSTARIVFAKDYDLPNIPKYWELKVLDEDKTAIYVKPPTYKITDGLPVESFNKWKKKYMDSLRKWADKLPKEGEKPEEKEAVTLESVIDDIMIDLF